MLGASDPPSVHVPVPTSAAAAAAATAAAVAATAAMTATHPPAPSPVPGSSSPASASASTVPPLPPPPLPPHSEGEPLSIDAKARPHVPRPARKPGRPATYVFDKPDDQLTEKERKMKRSIEKRRLRQNRSYHRRKAYRVKPSPPRDVATAAAVVGVGPTSPAPSSTAGAARPGAVPTPAPHDVHPRGVAHFNQLFDSTPDMPLMSHLLPHHPASLQHHASPSAHAPMSPMLAPHSVSTPPATASPSPRRHQSIAPPSSTSAAHVVPLTVPKFIPGFSQNPLDLLASATADRVVPPHSMAAMPMPESPHLHQSESVPMPLSCVESISKRVVPPEHMPGKSSIPVSIVGADQQGQSPARQLAPNAAAADATIDLVTPSAAMDISSFQFPFADDKQNSPDEHEEATDALVQTALVAAKEYARDSMNLKDAMDRETDLRRMTGIKAIVFENLRSKFVSLNANIQTALRHFVIFPRSFDLTAAAAVAGWDEGQIIGAQGMLNTMVQTNFITMANERYNLNEAARLFLNEDPAVLTENIAGSTYDNAQKRFVGHYRKILTQLQDDDIHKIGWLREKAMALYDCERENMDFSEYLLNGRNEDLREFLSAGITVMRYCVKAGKRERMLRKALSEDETSTENILMSLGTDDGVVEASTSSETANKSKETDTSHRARLHLALSEAFFDQLKTVEAEQPLVEALRLMGDLSSKAGATASGVVDSVLVLLLLSNLRLTSKRVKDARILCVKALRILAEAGLGRSTFGINAMSNLVTIYLMEGRLDKANSVATRLLDTLNKMRYTGMPIYADALGVCAMVSMAEGNYAEAEKQYGRALETVGKWGSKQWTGVPVQHCLDLDLWLMEGLAESIRCQGKIQEAMALEQLAARDRETRGFPRIAATPMETEAAATDEAMLPEGSQKQVSLRHLY